MQEEIDESDKRYNHLYSLVKDNKKKISMYESKGRELSTDINEILDRGPPADDFIGTSNSSQDRVNLLHQRLADAITENKEMKDELEMTNTNVKSFITEMSTVIGAHNPGRQTMDTTTLRLEEESGGGSEIDEQREDYHRPSKKYTPHYNTATQGGAKSQAKGKRRK